MRRHWQRRPLLVRGAFPDFRSPVGPSALFALAARDDVESRLVTAFGGRWKLRRGPFDPATLPARDRRRWTLLVQGVDTLLDEVHALLARFRFVADARLDDLMISWASDGGGVGPHQDSYDVFLLQAQGRRRWRIGPAVSTDLVAGVPLKILAHFAPDEEWVLEPGDMLYLPPGWAHDGVAVGECMTFSVGFRAPSRHELIRAWLAEQADATPAGPDPRFSDPGVAPTRRPGALPPGMHATLADWIRSWRPRAADVDGFIGRFLTEPKPNVWFDAPARPIEAAAFARRADSLGVRADRRTRMAYRGRQFFVNGERFAIDRGACATIARLADQRRLPPGALRGASVDSPLIACLRECFDAGWIRYDALQGRSGGRAGTRR